MRPASREELYRGLIVSCLHLFARPGAVKGIEFDRYEVLERHGRVVEGYCYVPSYSCILYKENKPVFVVTANPSIFDI